MKKIYIIAGESSGDFLGSELILSLKEKHPNIEILGIGGPLMEKQGLKSFFPTSELSVMGFVELLPHLKHIIKRINQTVANIIHENPDALITIDSSGFCYRVIKKLKKKIKKENKKYIPCIHYVAPQVWAWKPGRAKKLPSFMDCLLCLLPFEPKYFTIHGLKTYFVGHPLTQSPILPVQKNESVCRILVLPGSRRSEVETLLPIFLDTLKMIQKNNPYHKPIEIYLPTLPHIEKLVQDIIKQKNININITTDFDLKNEWLLNADFALAASGTVSLELAKFGIPHVIAYKVNVFTAILLKFFLKSKYVALPNILSDAEIVPECLQENCTSKYIYQKFINLNHSNQQKLKDSFNLLECPKKDLTPSQMCVEIIENFI